MFSRWIVGATLVAGVCVTGTAEARLSWSQAPKPNAAQQKYMDFKNVAGGLECEPKGELKKLLRDYSCYINMVECDAAADAIKGKHSPAMIQLFADLVEHDGKKFVNHCPGHQNFWELLGIYGLGYAQSTKHAPLIAKLVTKDKVKSAGANVLEAAAYSLWYMGDKRTAVSVFPSMIDYRGMWAKGSRWKQPALQALGRWGDKSAMDWCLKYMKSGDNDELQKSCVVYSGMVKDKRAVPTILRNLDKYKDVGIRALGQIGDRSAVSALEEKMDGANMWGGTATTMVALMNLGKTNYWADFGLMLEGKRPLTTKEKAKFAKKKKKAEKASSKRRAKAMKRYTKSYDKRVNKYEEKLQYAAQMESILLTNRSLVGKRDAALGKAASKRPSKKEWRGHVYGNIALAQLGKKKGASALVKLLGSSDEKQREAVVGALGGRERAFNSWVNRGYAGVSDKALINALMNYRGNESKKTRKANAIRAAATTRAFIKAGR